MRILVLAAGVVSLLLAGCTQQNTQETVRSTARGGLIGGGVGLVAGALNGKPVKGAAHGVVIGSAAGALVSVADQLFYGNGTGHDDGYVDGGANPNQGYGGGYSSQANPYPAQGQGGYYNAQAAGPEIDPRTGFRMPPPEYRYRY